MKSKAESNKDINFENSSEKEQLFDQIFSGLEYSVSHPTYDTELRFYNAVSDGNIELLNEIYSDIIYFKNERGILSDNPVNNARYHLVVTIAMITRFCIEKGLNEQTAYGLSDVYIRRIDKAKSIEELSRIHKKAVFEYANSMKEIEKARNAEKMMPKKLQLAIDYIYNHLNDAIRLTDISDAVDISESQLRRYFNSYFDTSPSDFIQKKKIDFAKNRLVYSDISYVDLANDLGYASHSHFIKMFKKYTGKTPAEYRNTYYRKHFKQ